LTRSPARFSFLEQPNLAPGEKTEYAFEVFAGPKYNSICRKFARAARMRTWRDDVDVTFAVLSRPMLALLKLFYGSRATGASLSILLTIFVKLLTFLFPLADAALGEEDAAVGTQDSRPCAEVREGQAEAGVKP